MLFFRCCRPFSTVFDNSIIIMVKGDHKAFRKERMPIDCLILLTRFPYKAGDTPAYFIAPQKAAERGTYD